MMLLFFSYFRFRQMQRSVLPPRFYRQMNETEIQQLIEGCRRGKRDAQLALYRQFARRLYNVCRRIVGGSDDAEEAMQDAMLKAFTRMDDYEDGTCFEAWITRIAVRTAIDYVRRQSPQWEELPANYDAEDEDDTPDEEEVRYSVARVKEAMEKLPSGYRVILSLYLFEGYDTEEIATILHIQPPSVRSQYLRAKRRLLDIITKERHG